MSDGSVRPFERAAPVRPAAPGQPVSTRSPEAIQPAAEVSSERKRERFDRAEIGGEQLGPKTYARFSIHEKTGLLSIKIVDADTDRVIREIPPESVARIAEELQRYLELRSRSGR